MDLYNALRLAKKLAINKENLPRLKNGDYLFTGSDYYELSDMKDIVDATIGGRTLFLREARVSKIRTNGAKNAPFSHTISSTTDLRWVVLAPRYKKSIYEEVK